MRPPLKIAVLISGGGRTLRNLIDRIQEGKLHAEIQLVISSNPDAVGLEMAHRSTIPVMVADPRDYDGQQAYGQAVFDACRRVHIDVAVMAGFLKFVPIPPDFENRVTNIHPALIPAFCGKGFYGLRVHQAVLDYGAKVSGCTVHFVDNQYDHGPIILQQVVPVLNDDTAENLAARVFAAECQAYPAALQKIALGQVRVEGRRVMVD